MQSFEVQTLESTKLPRFEEAYQALLPTLESLPAEQDHTPELDIPSVVAQILRLWPVLRAYGQNLSTSVETSLMPPCDSLRLYTLALGHAHALYAQAAEDLADCLTIPPQARQLYRSLVTGPESTASHLYEPTTVLELATALGQLIAGGLDPKVACRGQALIDKLESFANRCGHIQDTLHETARHRSVLLGLVVATYDAVRKSMLELQTMLPEGGIELPEVLGLRAD